MSVKLQIDGLNTALNGIEKISSAAARADLMDRIGAYGVASTQDRFLDETSPEGQKWKKSRRARDDGGQTLRDSNILFQSLTHNASAQAAEWGSNLIYAGIHQNGGDIVPKNAAALVFNIGGRKVITQKVTMPARPYLGLSSDDEVEIQAIADDWVMETLQ